MKRCPTCSRVYDNVSLRFCFDDGSELVNKVPDAGAPETAIMPGTTSAQPTIPAPPPSANAASPLFVPTVPIKKKSIVPWLIGAGALLLVLGVGAFAGIMLLRPKPLVHHLVLQFASETANRDATAVLAASVIKNRLNGLGVSRFEVKPGSPGSGQILVDLPALENPERVKRVISTWGKLEFVHIVSPANPAPTRTFATEQEAVTAIQSDGTIHGRALPYYRDAQPAANQPPRSWVIAEVPAVVDGFDIRRASAVRAPVGSDYDIQFSLKPDGANKFGTWTAAHINEYIGIVLNDEVKSIAFIKSQITDQGVITGRYTKESAEDLALVLNAGALPVPLQFVAEKIDPH